MFEPSWGMYFIKFLLTFPFLHSGIGCIVDFKGTTRLIASKKIPFPSLVLIAVISLKIGGSIALILGYSTALVCLALAAFTALATILYHDFWNKEGFERKTAIFWTTTNIGLIGGLFLLAFIS